MVTPGNGEFVAFIGLNPSTADENILDPTCRRCVDYAKRWGYTSYCMLNLFAFRSTDPDVMLKHPEPVGVDNDKWLLEVGSRANMLIAAWGNHGRHLNRGARVAAMFGDKLKCLAVNVDGSPQHPLYLPKDLKPKLYKVPA